MATQQQVSSVSVPSSTIQDIRKSGSGTVVQQGESLFLRTTGQSGNIQYIPITPTSAAGGLPQGSSNVSAQSTPSGDVAISYQTPKHYEVAVNESLGVKANVSGEVSTSPQTQQAQAAASAPELRPLQSSYNVSQIFERGPTTTELQTALPFLSTTASEARIGQTEGLATLAGATYYGKRAALGAGEFITSIPSFGKMLLTNPIEGGKGLVSGFVSTEQKITSGDIGQQAEAAGIIGVSILGERVGTPIFRAVAERSPIKISGISVPVEEGLQRKGTALVVSVGETGRGPVIGGILEGKPFLGKPSPETFPVQEIAPTGRGYEIITPAESKSITSDVLGRMGVPESEIAKIETGRGIVERAAGPNIPIFEEIPRESGAVLEPTEISSAVKYLSGIQGKIEPTGGSFAGSIYSKDILFKDIDIHPRSEQTAESIAAGIGGELQKSAGPGREFSIEGTKVSLSIEGGKPTKVVEVLTSKDIDQSMSGITGREGFEGVFGVTFKRSPVGVEGIKLSSLTELLRRSSASVSSLQGPLSRAEFARSPKESEGGLTVGPPAIRLKDIVREQIYGRTRAEQLKLNPRTRQKGIELENLLAQRRSQFPEIDFEKEIASPEAQSITIRVSQPRQTESIGLGRISKSLSSKSFGQQSISSSSIQFPTSRSVSFPSRSSSPRSLSLSSIGSIGSAPSLSSLSSPRSPTSPGISTPSFPSPGTSPPSVPSIISLPSSPPSPPSVPYGRSITGSPPSPPSFPPSFFPSEGRGRKKSKRKFKVNVPKTRYTATLTGLIVGGRAKSPKGPLYKLGSQGKALSFSGLEVRLPGVRTLKTKSVFKRLKL